MPILLEATNPWIGIPPLHPACAAFAVRGKVLRGESVQTTISRTTITTYNPGSRSARSNHQTGMVPSNRAVGQQEARKDWNF